MDSTCFSLSTLCFAFISRFTLLSSGWKGFKLLSWIFITRDEQQWGSWLCGWCKSLSPHAHMAVFISQRFTSKVTFIETFSSWRFFKIFTFNAQNVYESIRFCLGWTTFLIFSFRRLVQLSCPLLKNIFHRETFSDCKMTMKSKRKNIKTFQFELNLCFIVLLMDSKMRRGLKIRYLSMSISIYSFVLRDKAGKICLIFYVFIHFQSKWEARKSLGTAIDLNVKSDWQLISLEIYLHLN